MSKKTYLGYKTSKTKKTTLNLTKYQLDVIKTLLEDEIDRCGDDYKDTTEACQAILNQLVKKDKYMGVEIIVDDKLETGQYYLVSRNK